MTEDDLTKFLSENKEAVMAATRAAVIEKIQESIKWSLPSTITDIVRDFLEKEIAPEIAKELAAQKGPILAAAKKSAVALSNTLAEKMMEQCVKSLDGYRAEKVFKALLGADGRY